VYHGLRGREYFSFRSWLYNEKTSLSSGSIRNLQTLEGDKDIYLHNKNILVLLILISTLTFVSGCSVTHTVNTKSTKSLARELKQISKTVENVKVTFTRPDLLIKINMTKEPGQEILDSILSNVKTFATVDNMNDIASSVKWDLEVSEIHLAINSDKDNQTIEHAYFARYFKTYNASTILTLTILGLKMNIER
jgi:outer membrane lipoprotein-sorting protein